MHKWFSICGPSVTRYYYHIPFPIDLVCMFLRILQLLGCLYKRSMQYYSDIENKISPAILMKLCVVLTEGFILLHDSMRRCTVQLTQTGVGDPFTEPTLAHMTSIYLGPLIFNPIEKLKDKQQQWLWRQPKEFCARDIHKWQEWWDKSINGPFFFFLFFLTL